MLSSATHVETVVPAPLPIEQLQAQVRAKDQTIEQLSQRVQALTHQLDWFRRQMFGSKSERRVLVQDAQQISLGEILNQGSAAPPPAKRRVVAEHTRAVNKVKDEGESLPFFDATQVPMETIELPVPEALALSLIHI